jgi:hypothetical protein
MRPFVSAMIASLSIASVAFGQTKAGARSASATPSDWAVDGSLGFAAPDYGTASVGFDLMGAAEWHPKNTLPVAFRGELGWDYFGYGSGNVNGNQYSANSNILRFDVDALYDIPVHWTSKLQPYLLGGLGLYHVSASGCANGVCVGGGSDTNLGINLGGGLRYPFGPVDGFFELRWHEAFAYGDAAFFPFQFGVRYRIPAK